MIRDNRYKCEGLGSAENEKFCKQHGTASRETWLQQAIRGT